MAEESPYRVAKRAEDVAISALLLVVLSPVIAAAYVVIVLDMLFVPADRGSFLYRERRVSRGREFDLLKFRVLRKGVLATAAGHARPLEADVANLTWAGRNLKRWYLDELPQLVNVLLGDMSLVGPRPWPPALVAAQVERRQVYRLHVPAGWTGPAQVTKGVEEDGDYEALDLAYVRALHTLSGPRLVWCDLGLLAKSARTLTRGEGLRF